MKKIIFLLFVSVFISVTVRADSITHFPLVIYGEDQRRDLFEIRDSAWLQMADSTVALFKSSQLGASELSLRKFGSSNNLCDTERFYEQMAGAFCSGALVAPDLVMTAGHCVQETRHPCSDLRIVFGFAMKAPTHDPSAISFENVYQCTSIVSKVETQNGLDYALIRLDRPVTNRVPLRLERGVGVVNGTPLVMMGHPSGLPLKVTMGGSVRNAHQRRWFSPEKPFFRAEIDSYGGNSGSPVFNAKTGLIVGILVRGELDFVPRDDRVENSCRVSNHCNAGFCRGEDVVKTSFIQNLIPE